MNHNPPPPRSGCTAAPFFIAFGCAGIAMLVIHRKDINDFAAELMSYPARVRELEARADKSDKALRESVDMVVRNLKP